MEDYIDKKIEEVEKKMDFVNGLAQRRDEHIMQRLDIIDGRILTVLNTLASTRR
jgi:tetrahydromethanopterin S-methyltransferase subunit G